MTKADEEILEKNGWSVDCESPFEISHEDGSTATLNAARMVVDYLRAFPDDDDDTLAEDNTEYES